MATVQINVIYNSEKETLNQALASLLTAKSDTTETPAQMSLFDKNDIPQADPALAQASETALRTAAHEAQRYIPCKDIPAYIQTLTELGLTPKQLETACCDYVIANIGADQTPDVSPSEERSPDPAAISNAQPDAQPEPKKISKADVRALTIELSKKNKTALKSIFKDLGASCFSEVKEENYPEFHKKLSAALNKSKEAVNG